MRIALLLVAIWPAVAAAQSPAPKGIEFFESKIRPVLVQHCYQCHSEESVKAKKLRGGLLLDTRDGVLKGGESGPAIVPGKPKEGHLLEALRYDGDVKMPPKGKLPAEVVADFAKWIDMGAPDPRDGKVDVKAKTIDVEAGKKWWAFQPLASPAPPAVKNAAWGKTPIDRFLAAKLEEKGLTPNGPVSREKLIRRVHFDLWGLPPTPAEIDAFVADTSPDAYEKLVDRLLAGPAYGERWARHWLDVVRFAESGGYEFDGDRPGAFHYRDWVIKALNADMPYDQFVREQIAGDVLKPGDFSAATATGFLVAGPYPGQTTSKTIQLIRYNHLDDMVSTIGSGLLGLTLGCARCHDHKYDPLPQQDYYNLVAHLARTDSQKANLDPQPEIYAKAKAEFDATHAPLVKAVEAFEKDELPKRLEDWRTKSPAPAAPWQALELDETKAKIKLRPFDDGSVLFEKAIDKADGVVFTARTKQKGIVAFRIEALADPAFPKSGPGIDPSGLFSIAEIKVEAAPLGGKAKATPIKLKAVASTSETKDQPASAAVDGNGKTAWSIEPSEIGKNHALVVETAGPLGDDKQPATQLIITIDFGKKGHAMGRPRIAFTTRADHRDLASPAERQHAEELRVELKDGPLTTANRPAIVRWFRAMDPELDGLLAKVDDHNRIAPQPKLVPTFVAQGNRGGDVHFLVRGEVERKGAKANPGTLKVLTRAEIPPSTDPRVALADWLTDVDRGAGPLLARVMVNRLWQHHFGRGLVATPNDFGIQGDPPTHPELLDHLAARLVQAGWKLKSLHKEILLSEAYRQSGEVRSEAMKVDPSNKLWWRRPSLRMEAEVVRDNLLAVGGTLDRTPFGAGTLDANTPRRSIYLTVKRSQPIPLLYMLDAPETIQSVGERSLTTVPTQALAFMNSPLVRKQAEALAKSLRSQSKENLGDAIDAAFLTTLGRRPAPAERQRLQAFVERQAADYGENGLDAALADFCQTLMCLNEFIYVD